MNRRSLLAAGVAFVGWLSGMRPTHAVADNVGFLEPVIGTAYPRPFQMTSLFEQINMSPGQIAEFPLYLLHPGLEEENRALCSKLNVDPEKFVDSDYIWVPPYIIEDKEKDALNLLMACGSDLGIVLLDKETYHDAILKFHKRKNKIHDTLDLVIADSRLQNPVFSQTLKSHVSYDFLKRKEDIISELIDWDAEKEAIVICVSNHDNSFVNPIHGDIGQEGLAILNNKNVTVGKVKL